MILFIVLTVLYLWVFFGKSKYLFICLFLISCSSSEPLLKPTGTVLIKNNKGVFVSFPSKDGMGAAWFDIEANEGDTLEIVKR